MQLHQEMDNRIFHANYGKMKICMTLISQQCLAGSSAMIVKHFQANHFTLEISHLPYSYNLAPANVSLFPR
jgi:hypothetical protein